MSTVSKLAAPAVSGFDTKEMTWNHLEGGDDFDYHIDYWIAILGCRPDEGRIEFLGKWEPNAYCHYHRHLGETTTIVLEGEHHLIEETETQKIHKTRTRGHYSKSPYGEAHMERAGESEAERGRSADITWMPLAFHGEEEPRDSSISTRHLDR